MEEREQNPIHSYLVKLLVFLVFVLCHLSTACVDIAAHWQVSQEKHLSFLRPPPLNYEVSSEGDLQGEKDRKGDGGRSVMLIKR